jgi:hypothetical protein
VEVIMGVSVRRWSGSIPLVLTVLIAGCSSTSPQTKSLTLAEADDGRGVVVAISAALARDLLESAIGSDFDCEGEVDREFGSMLRTLDRRGPGSQATLTDEETTVVARRRNRTLKLEIRDRSDGSEIEAVMPWAVAECLMGRTTTLEEGAVGDVRVKIKGKGGGSFEFRID